MVAVSKDEEGKPKYARMQVVPDLKGKTIGEFAKGYIKEGSTVQTDAYHSYRKPLSVKYLHEYQVFDADSDMLKWLHTIIGNAKAFVSGTFHGLGSKHLQRFLINDVLLKLPFIRAWVLRCPLRRYHRGVSKRRSWLLSTPSRDQNHGMSVHLVTVLYFGKKAFCFTVFQPLAKGYSLQSNLYGASSSTISGKRPTFS